MFCIGQKKQIKQSILWVILLTMVTYCIISEPIKLRAFVKLISRRARRVAVHHLTEHGYDPRKTANKDRDSVEIITPEAPSKPKNEIEESVTQQSGYSEKTIHLGTDDSDENKIGSRETVNRTKKQRVLFEKVVNAETYIKSATYDPRDEANKIIRIWAITRPSQPAIYCHIKEIGANTPVAVTASIQLQRSFISPYCGFVTAVITCPYEGKSQPSSVSVSTSLHNATNSWITVHIPKYKPPKTQKYGICVRTLEYKNDKDMVDIMEIMEWIEIQKLLGVHKIIIYDTENCGPEFKAVLETYEKQGILVIEPWPLPVKSLSDAIYKKQSNISKAEISATLKESSREECVQYHAQHLAHMDCMYRYMDEFSHLAFIDVDEFIIPSGATLTWKDMIAKIEYNPSMKYVAAYGFQESCFDFGKTIDPGMLWKDAGSHKFRQYWRLAKFRVEDEYGMYFKSIIKPQYVTDMYIHRPKSVLKNFERNVTTPGIIGRMNHYRSPCKFVEKYEKSQQTLKYDEIMDKYFDQLPQN